MDTLCIPVGVAGDAADVASDIGHLKQTAIDKMAVTYAGASAVLVLDSELQQRSISADVPDVEMLSRIVCSTWMWRCWTLQEGAMARSAYIQCSNGAVAPL